MGTAIVIVIGLATGFVASMVFWLWQARLFQPKIQICPALADYTLPDDPDKIPRCEFTLINRGHRAAADLTITAHALVPGLMGTEENVWLRLREESLPWTGAGRDEQYFLYLSRIPDDDKKAYGSRLPERIARSLRGTGPEVGIREFLDACDNSAIQVVVAASDSVFGGRSFVRHIFRYGDFRDDQGVFKKGVPCGYSPCCQARRSNWREFLSRLMSSA